MAKPTVQPSSQVTHPPVPATHGGARGAEQEVATQIPPLENLAQALGDVKSGPVGSHPAGPITPKEPTDELAGPGWKREQQLKLAHHYGCPLTKGGECECGANLVWLEKHGLTKKEPNEAGSLLYPAMKWSKERDAWVQDNGNPKAERPLYRLPRVMCHACGWATRGVNVGHKCDPAATRVRSGVAPIHLTLTQDERFSGRYRLAFYRRADMDYDVVEEFLSADLKTVERSQHLNPDGPSVGMMWDECQGLIGSEVVERFSP